MSQILGVSCFLDYEKSKLESKRGLVLAVLDWLDQGYNARKVILEVYASSVLQCTVSGR